MSYTVFTQPDEIIFRPFLPWFLAKRGLLLGLGGICVVIAVPSGDMRWLLGTVIVTLIAILLSCEYLAQAVIIRNYDLVFRRGILSRYEKSFPLWQVNLETRQSLFGRIFDYGTICLHAGEEVVEMHMVTSMRTFRYMVTQRRQEVFGTVRYDR